MKSFFRFTVWVFFFLAFALMAALAFLFRFEHPLPRFALEALEERLSGSNCLFRVDRAFVHLPGKVRLEGVRVLDRTRAQARPVLSARRVDLRLDYDHFPIGWNNVVREVVVTGLNYPRLPEGYYVPDSVEFPGQPDFKEVNAPLALTLPNVRPFRLELRQSEVLAVRPALLVAEAVGIAGNRLHVDGVSITWPDTDVAMSLKGEMSVDLVAQEIKGIVYGQARQRNIRPMLQALDISNSYQFVDAFTGVESPVDASCRFAVDLRTCDLDIFLDLHPSRGAYRGVAFDEVQGTVDVRVFVRDVYQNAHIHVGPLVANLADGSSMRGSVFYENTNDVGYVTFDVDSTTSLSNALTIANCLTDGTLDLLQPETPPHILLKGRTAVDMDHHAEANDLRGSISFARGTFMGIPLFDAATSFHVLGRDVTFTGAAARSRRGGRIKGDAKIELGLPPRQEARQSTRLLFSSLPIEDLAEFFQVDVAGRSGTLDGTIELSSPVGTNALSRLCGRGSLRCHDGRLGQVPLFSGLTKLLAEKVPGVSWLVGQSRGEFDYVLNDGMMKITGFSVAGDVFTITGGGTYDIVRDRLDCSLRVQLLKNESLLARIANPTAWKFMKLLEFRLTGPIDDPKWHHALVGP